MLILTRKKGEMIKIGDNIEVWIGEILGGQVKVAIEAPKHIKIMRQELLNRKPLEEVKKVSAPIELPVIKVKKTRKKVAL